MTFALRHAAALAAVWAFCLVASGGAQADGGVPGERVIAPSVVGGCQPTRMHFIATNSTEQQTTSTEYVNMPQAGVGFTQHERGCVIVQFAGVVFANSVGDIAHRIMVRAVLEGTNRVATPRNVQLSGDDDEENDGRWARAHGMNFVFPDVPEGEYRVQMQWRSPQGGTIYVHQHTVLVQHE